VLGEQLLALPAGDAGHVVVVLGGATDGERQAEDGEGEGEPGGQGAPRVARGRAAEAVEEA